LLHGLNSSSQQWYYQRLFFKQRFRLVIIDLPGHGRSRSPQQANLSIPVLAADLSYLLGLLNIQDPILYGHSMGAMAVMQYCVEGLMPRANAVLLQHGSYTDPFKTTPLSPLVKWLERPVVQPFCRFVQRHPLLFRWIGWLNYLNGLSLLFYRFLFFTGDQTPAQLRFMSRIAAINPPEAVAEGLLQCMKFDVSDALNRIDMPALVLSAKHDRLIATHAAAHIASSLNNAQLLEINAGHQSIAEVPENVNEAINAWLLIRANPNNYSGN
jgi:pimeloyl-ACP methyl ester carboxylesterase